MLTLSYKESFTAKVLNYLVSILDVLSAKLQSPGNEINSTEFNGFYREMLNVYKVGSRRVNQLKNIGPNGPIKSSKKRKVDTLECSDIEYVPVKKIKGHSFCITYQSNEIKQLSLQQTNEVTQPPTTSVPDEAVPIPQKTPHTYNSFDVVCGNQSGYLDTQNLEGNEFQWGQISLEQIIS